MGIQSWITIQRPQGGRRATIPAMVHGAHPMFASLSVMVHEFDMTEPPRIRFYVDATVAASTDQAHYPRRVMRRGPGDAVGAAEQCGRMDVPEVRDPIPLDAALEDWPNARRLFWADETGGGAAPEAFAGATTAARLIGPEGGFSDDERARPRGHAAATAIDLGPRILRADTAALATLALWQGTAGDWGP